MNGSLRNLMKAVVVLLFSLAIISCGGGGGGSTSGSSTNGGSTPPLSAQIQDLSNWQVYQGKDNTNTNLLASSSILRKLMLALKRSPSIVPSANALDLSGITTYSSNGIVSSWLQTVYIDDRFIVTGSLDLGYSVFNVADATAPQGKIVNFRGTPENNQLNNGPFGFQGAAKNPVDDKIYAWFGKDIIQVNTGAVVCSQAPHFANTQTGELPQDRMVFDNQGNLWLGTVGRDTAGARLTYAPDMNGLYRFSPDFSTRVTVLDETVSVWNLFKDAAGTIWVATDQGIYRIPSGDSPAVVWDLSSQSKYAQQIFEFNGAVYASVKNFFNVHANIQNYVYDLYKWDGTTFTYVCNIFNQGQYKASAFVWQNDLYFTNSWAKKFNGTDAFAETAVFGRMGDMAAVYGDTVASAGVDGLYLYNLGNSGQTVRLTSTNTAEGLIVNALYCLHLDENGSLFIGTFGGGFNEYANDEFRIFETPDGGYVKGLCSYNNRLYVSTWGNTYYLENDQIQPLDQFEISNGRTYRDRNFLWGVVGNGDTDGNISYINLESGQKLANLQFDQPYHFYDVIKIPNENAVFIGVGKLDNIQTEYAVPYVLKYTYDTGAYEKVALPNAASKGVYMFCLVGSDIYGVGNRELYRFKDGSWQAFSTIDSSFYITAARGVGNSLFITSNGGALEVVDLNTKASSLFTTNNCGLPSNYIQDLAVQHIGSNDYRLWFATMNGLAECVITLAAE